MKSVDISADELRLLAKALREEADRVSDYAKRCPLRSQDEDTERYDLFDQASSMYDRAREIQALSECRRCGSPLENHGYCTDETCPYSRYLQDEAWSEGLNDHRRGGLVHHPIYIYRGSAFDVKADAIVSPANSAVSAMFGRAHGLAGLIEREAMADPALSQDFVGDISGLGSIPTGSAAVTSPGALSQRGFKAIIHAVGPIWDGGSAQEAALLRRAYAKALAIAEKREYKSVVFPAISAGIFGVPIQVVAASAVASLRDAPESIEVYVALMSDEHIRAFRMAGEREGYTWSEEVEAGSANFGENECSVLSLQPKKPIVVSEAIREPAQ